MFIVAWLGVLCVCLPVACNMLQWCVQFLIDCEWMGVVRQLVFHLLLMTAIEWWCPVAPFRMCCMSMS